LNVIHGFFKKYGEADVFCDKSEPETINYFNQNIRDGVEARPYPHNRNEGIRELGGRFIVAGDGRPRIYINSKCINLIGELMEYSEKTKSNDHAVDALRYSIPLKKDPPTDAWVFGY
jgi:hypothetical protein